MKLKLHKIQASHFSQSFPSFSSSSSTIQNLQRVSDYDAFGFDVDHTLARYRVMESWELIKELVTPILQKKGYPIEQGTLKELGLNKMIITNPLIDFRRGITLKLGQGGKILRGTQAEERICRSQVNSFLKHGVPASSFVCWKKIKDIYGGDYTISLSNFEAMTKRYNDMYFSVSYYEPTISILANRIMKNLKKNPMKRDSFLPEQIFRDVTEAQVQQFKHYKEGEIFYYKNHTEYYRRFYNNLENFVFPLPRELPQAFKRLKEEQGKKFFVITSSHSGPCIQKLKFFFGEVASD